MSRFTLQRLIGKTQTSQGGWPADSGGGIGDRAPQDAPDPYGDVGHSDDNEHSHEHNHDPDGGGGFDHDGGGGLI